MHLGTPPAEVEISLEQAAALIQQQFPQYQDLPLQPFANGWDNLMLRLGPDLGLRLPRRQAAVSLLLREAEYLPQLAAELNLAIPTPLYVGKAQGDYPYPWLIVPWLAGDTANREPLQTDQASVFDHFLQTLHRLPALLPASPFRSTALSDKAEMIAQRLQRIAAFARIEPTLLALWQAACAAQAAPHLVWIHGDLHARNVLVEQGRFSAIVDWGDMCSGDPAVDLGGIWSLFPQAEARAHFIQSAHYGRGDGDFWLRAAGWAFYVGVVLVDSGRIDHPEHEAMGWDYLQRLQADLDSGLIRY